MKVFVATSEEQGHRTSDFCKTNEDESVFFEFPCDRDRENIDGGCGCHRSLTGMDSGMSTTTFRVVDVDITEEGLVEEYVHLKNSSGDRLDDEIEELQSYARQDLSILWDAANSFPVGTVVERRGFDFQTRPSASWRYPQNEIDDSLI